jgi:uracil-DNA glycosylase
MTIKEKLGDWVDAIPTEQLDSVLLQIGNRLMVERQKYNVLPEAGSELMFKAFRLTPYSKVRVVIIGQDIYQTGAFNGVAFGNGLPHKPTTKIQPSLRNIIKEVERSYSGKTVDPSLYHWSDQGVLLMNTGHTVRYGDAGSHIDIWADFTKLILNAICKKDNIVWLLWGKYAQEYEEFIQNKTHYVIVTGHPSPLNTTNPFVGCNCFLECDKILGKNKINW